MKIKYQTLYLLRPNSSTLKLSNLIWKNNSPSECNHPIAYLERLLPLVKLSLMHTNRKLCSTLIIQITKKRVNSKNFKQKGFQTFLLQWSRRQVIKSSNHRVLRSKEQLSKSLILLSLDKIFHSKRLRSLPIKTSKSERRFL